MSDPTILIGKHLFTLCSSHSLTDGPTSLYGRLQEVTDTIDLNRDVSRVRWYETLWHELIHPHVMRTPWPASTEDEERWIDGMAAHIVQLLIDNPEVLAYETAPYPGDPVKPGSRGKDHRHPRRQGRRASQGP